MITTDNWIQNRLNDIHRDRQEHQRWLKQHQERIIEETRAIEYLNKCEEELIQLQQAREYIQS